jgi:hypothetical protein
MQHMSRQHRLQLHSLRCYSVPEPFYWVVLHRQAQLLVQLIPERLACLHALRGGVSLLRRGVNQLYQLQRLGIRSVR